MSDQIENYNYCLYVVHAHIIQHCRSRRLQLALDSCTELVHMYVCVYVVHMYVCPCTCTACTVRSCIAFSLIDHDLHNAQPLVQLCSCGSMG